MQRALKATTVQNRSHIFYIPQTDMHTYIGALGDCSLNSVVRKWERNFRRKGWNVHEHLGRRGALVLAAAFPGIEFPHDSAMCRTVDGIQATHASTRSSTRPRRRRLRAQKFLFPKREYQHRDVRFLFVQPLSDFFFLTVGQKSIIYGR